MCVWRVKRPLRILARNNFPREDQQTPSFYHVLRNDTLKHSAKSALFIHLENNAHEDPLLPPSLNSGYRQRLINDDALCRRMAKSETVKETTNGWRCYMHKRRHHTSKCNNNVGAQQCYFIISLPIGNDYSDDLCQFSYQQLWGTERLPKVNDSDDIDCS